jgi:four helix bundle protein
LVTSFVRNSEAFAIGCQLLRSGTSVGANLAEAVSARSRQEYKNIHNIALKECHETIYGLELSAEMDLTDCRQIQKVLNEAREISKILAKTVIRLSE